MNTEQVALQLYTLRDFCQTASGYADTLRKVRAIGYQAIQISGLGPIPATDLRSIADGEGLTICATHEPGAAILDEPARVAERLSILGCKYTGYPYPHGVDFDDARQVETLIHRLDAAGAALRQAGKVLVYHNHAHEFVRYEGRPLLDAIYARTSAENLKAELDTYWVQAGGGNPVEWCRKLAHRLPLLHLKDYAVTARGEPRFAEIGAGNLHFRAIIAAAEQSGCEWFIVEQDTCAGDPFASVAQSFRYLCAHLVN